MRNATIIPNGRDDTYDTSEVSRKSIEQMFDTAFNADQKKVLLAMFSQDGSGGSGCDCGFECTESWVTLTEESVTTIIDGNIPTARADLSYSNFISNDVIRVTFNGIEYVCSKYDYETEAFYGAEFDGSTETYDWSVYPFAIYLGEGFNELDTETAGTYSIKIEAVETSVETSDCFRKAVESIAGDIREPLVVNVTSGTFDKTAKEVCDAFYNQQAVYAVLTDDDKACLVVSYEFNDRSTLYSFYVIGSRSIQIYASTVDSYPTLLQEE